MAIPRSRLTKSAIDDLRVLSEDTVYWDAGLPGFSVKVTPKGRKVFIVMYRLAGAGSRLRKYTIGPYGRITLPMARAQAQRIFAARLDGRDPAEEKKQSRRRLVVDRIDDLIERFIQEHVSRVGTSKRLTSLLRRDVIPYWGTKSILLIVGARTWSSSFRPSNPRRRQMRCRAPLCYTCSRPLLAHSGHSAESD